MSTTNHHPEEEEFLATALRWLRSAREEGAIKSLLVDLASYLAATHPRDLETQLSRARTIAARLDDTGAPAPPSVRRAVESLVNEIERTEGGRP